MSRHDREPIGQTVVKVLAAVVLVLLALGFGAMGACRAVFSVADIWDRISRRGSGISQSVFVLLLALWGLGVAGVSIWRVVVMFGKRRGRRDE